MTILPADAKHGTLNCYRQFKCRCEACKVAKSYAAKEYYLRNRERTISYSKKWQAENPDRVKLYHEAYSKNNSERLKEKSKVWHSKNNNRAKEYASQYQKNNPEKFLEYMATRRAKKLNQFVELVDRQVLYERDGGICYLCDKPVKQDGWHLDHKIPLSKGGEHSYANTGVTHPHCNMSKGARLIDGSK